VVNLPFDAAYDWESTRFKLFNPTVKCFKYCHFFLNIDRIFSTSNCLILLVKVHRTWSIGEVEVTGNPRICRFRAVAVDCYPRCHGT
jgi:hypothetical protein